MSRARAITVVGVVLAALAGRQLVPNGAADEELPPLPVMRSVDAELVDSEWTPSTGLRDPFVPLILPDPPPLPASEEGEDGESAPPADDG